MAKQQQPKASWLDRRREAKRVKKEKRAQRIADQRQYEGASAEHATHGWTSSSSGGPG
jgi:hypothetical protein